ncbi:MAG TPA: WG repeat-containing protein [Flavobacterium sp.]
MISRLIFLIVLNFSNSACAQAEGQLYTVGQTSNLFGEYSFIDSKGDTIRKLPDKKYNFCFTRKFVNFAIFGISDKSGWYAIDINEKILFQIYNTSYGEVSPDTIIEDKIRIIDKDKKIGFAHKNGQIIIPPQFEEASHFDNGFAIISEDCEKIPWQQHNNHSGCQHFSTKCRRNGYINAKGEIIKIGDYTVEELEKEIRRKKSRKK